MFIKDEQSWDKFVISVDKEIKIQDLLRDELGFSARSISRLKREKNIYVNGKYTKPTLHVDKGDIIGIPIIEEGSDFEGQDLNVRVLYEDFDLVVVDKPPFMVVHPTKSHYQNTLANHLSYHLDQEGQDVRVRFVNRLDMNTSGLVIVAKNAYAHHKLSSDMSDKLVEKEYYAIVNGVPDHKEATIDQPIYRETEDSIKRIVDPKGQRSITHYSLIGSYKDCEGHLISLLRISLETGRTHQIRVHMDYIGHPIVSDELYGQLQDNLIGRQALHARKLVFNQPRMKNEIELVADLPDDMVRLLDKCEKI